MTKEYSFFLIDNNTKNTYTHTCKNKAKKSNKNENDKKYQ